MKTLQQNPSDFQTRDIYVATILKLSGIPIVRVQRNGGRGIFVFKGSEKIEGLIAEFFNGELRMDPKGLFETWKSLKAMAFSTIGDVR